MLAAAELAVARGALAKQDRQALAEVIPGVRGVYGGRLRNARQVEGLTANLIAINRRYKAHSGIRVTDV